MPPGQNGDCHSPFCMTNSYIFNHNFIFSFIGTFLTTVHIASTKAMGAILLKGDRLPGETYFCVQKQLLILIK